MKCFLLAFAFSLSASAQVLCIKCYNQNARVLTDTNNLILNGGFENTTCHPINNFRDTSFCPNSQIYNCDISNWVCTGGGPNTYADICDSSFSPIVEGTKAVYFGNYFCNPCSANHTDISCIINTGCEVIGIPTGYPDATYSGYGGDTGVSLSQTVNGLIAGDIYTLEFWSGGENVGSNSGLFALDVGFGDIFLRNPRTPAHTGIGRRFIIVFIAASVQQTIKFTNWGHIYLATELVLDDVRLLKSISAEDPCTTSINSLSQTPTPTIFPNPATNRFTITKNTTHPSQIILYDIASRRLMEEKFIGEVSLNVEHLSKGIYLYEVRGEKEDITRGRVVIQ